MMTACWWVDSGGKVTVVSAGELTWSTGEFVYDGYEPDLVSPMFEDQ